MHMSLQIVVNKEGKTMLRSINFKVYEKCKTRENFKFKFFKKKKKKRGQNGNLPE